MTERSQMPSVADAKYKFTGKERDTKTGYDYFGARYYDSRIGRWMQPEPLYKKHLEWNPYNYVLDNPLNLIDPDGKQIASWDVSLGMPITIPQSLEEIKIRTYAFLGITATTAAAYYAPEAVAGITGWWLRNSLQANEIASEVIGNLSNAPTGIYYFSKASAIEGLNVGELQRLNVANEVKLGFKTATEAAKSLAEGGAKASGKIVEGGGKLIDLLKIAKGEYQVVVKAIENGKIVSTLSTTGTAKELGVKNIDKLIEMGKPYSRHYLQEIK